MIKTYCGHGINTLFHCSPNIPHYAKNKAVGEAKEGMCFTIEPMIALGTHKDKTWPDDWTSVTQDGKRTAQFGKSHSISVSTFTDHPQSILFWLQLMGSRFSQHELQPLLVDQNQCQCPRLKQIHQANDHYS